MAYTDREISQSYNDGLSAADDMRSRDESYGFSGRQSRKSALSKSNISRTGGEVQIYELKGEDENQEREFNSDDFNKIDYELRQFDNKMKKMNV